MIKLQVLGNLGKDCVQSEYNGRYVCNFSVAHTEKYTDAQGIQQSKTTWVECSYWTSKPAGIAPYLKRGTTVFVEGAPTADSYTNQQGQAAATLRLNVREIQLAGAPRVEGSNTDAAPINASSSTPQVAPQGSAPVYTPPTITDGERGSDLPF